MENLPGNELTQRKVKRSTSFYWGLALAVVLILGVVIGYLVGQAQTLPNAPSQPVIAAATFTPGRQPAAQTSQSPTQTPAQKNLSTPAGTGNNADKLPTPTIMDFVLSDARHFQGNPDAPITMVEFSDFKCPFCGRFTSETLGPIRAQYIDTGKVRFVYKHFAILGSESNRAAEASECASEQDKFWEYHDTLFADQVSTRSTLNDERLVSLATEIGLETTTFRECLTSGRYTAQIGQESLTVQSMGMRGTPSFLVNGVFLYGAQPFEAFQQVIEQLLGNNQAPVNQPPAAGEPLEQTASTQSPPTEEPASLEEEIEGVVFFPEQSRDHQEGKIDYAEVMPPGGKHSDAWQNCGIYDEPLPKEAVVHSLEHGAIWIAYQPDLQTDQVEALRVLVRQELQAGNEPLVLLSPEPDLEAPIVATAWQAQLSLDDASDKRLALFLSRYQNGPFTPEPGAPCTGGVGEPLD